jgi:DNA-binding SARP family transcriptional activator
MALFRAWLFGKPEFSCKAYPSSFELPQKAEQLFCYLLCHRDQKHYREQLAEILWYNSLTAQGKPYFRKALWQLQVSLKNLRIQSGKELLEITSEWIGINQQANLWVDTIAFEHNFELTRDLRGSQLSSEQYLELQKAAALYRGEFLESLYSDWCIVERERFKEIFLMIMDKLMGYCETHLHFDTGVAYGHKILGFDRAHEHTHYRLMRLKCLAGDRTGALRQYEICRKALREELNVEPSERTSHLWNQIINDLPSSSRAPLNTDTNIESDSESQTLRALHRITELQIFQTTLQVELQREIATLEALLTAKA